MTTAVCVTRMSIPDYKLYEWCKNDDKIFTWRLVRNPFWKTVNSERSSKTRPTRRRATHHPVTISQKRANTDRITRSVSDDWPFVHTLVFERLQVRVAVRVTRFHGVRMTTCTHPAYHCCAFDTELQHQSISDDGIRF